MKKYSLIILASILLLTALSIILYRKYQPVDYDDYYSLEHSFEDSVLIPEIILDYGIPVDSFRIEEGTVRRNQNLSHILSAFNISNQVIHQIANAPREIFDARRIRAGSTYKMFFSNDSSNIPKYFVYKHDPVQFVRIKLYDTLLIERDAKEVTRVLKAASGQINSSLWNALAGNHAPPALAMDLADIYQWTVDFFALAKGDEFRLYYYENFIDSTSVGVDKIKAAYFQHQGRELYAIPFEQDSVLSFFDQDGNSLRRAFLRAPLRYSRISSGFSHSRLHPIHRVHRPHHGVDYAAPTGTPVYAIGDGRVLQANYSGGNGNMVRIRHNSVYTTGYLHLRNFAPGIRPNVWVSQGDLIGYVGATGTATGPHLCFRVWRNGQPVNPLAIESPPVEPVSEENIEAFNRERDRWLEEFSSLTGNQ